MRLEASDVRSALSAEQVIQQYGLKAKRRGSQYRLVECPRCRHRSSSEAVAIDATSGSWCHHGSERAAGGECSGDILDLIAACEGLSTKRDFRQVIERAAVIAGITDTVSEFEREQRIRQAKERARQEVVAELERRITSRCTAGAAWESLSRRDARGEQYLASRGLSAQDLIASDAVRFSRVGPVVAIRDADGFPTSTATRQYEGHPKVLALRDHSTRGTMVGAVSDICHERTVVIVEGVMDALTARLAWPTATVLGANGAGNVAKVAEQAISRIRVARTRLLIVPHDDEPGIRAATEAGRIAVAAGLELDDDLEIVDLPAPDLNAAWSDGWRPRLNNRPEALQQAPEQAQAQAQAPSSSSPTAAPRPNEQSSASPNPSSATTEHP